MLLRTHSFVNIFPQHSQSLYFPEDWSDEELSTLRLLNDLKRKMWTIFRAFIGKSSFIDYLLLKCGEQYFGIFCVWLVKAVYSPAMLSLPWYQLTLFFFPSYATYYFSYLEEYFVISCFSTCVFMVGFGNKLFLLKELKDHVEFLRGHRLLVIRETEPRERGESSSETLQITLLFCSPSSYTSSEFVYSF